jgi:hypothetical protein
MPQPESLHLKKLVGRAAATLCVAACLAADGGFRVSIATPQVLGGIVDNRYLSLKLSHSIDGYLVSCDRRRILVWGRPMKFNSDAPQEATLTVVDTRSLKIGSEVRFSKGIHSAEFLAERSEAIIGTEMGAMIDLETGKILPSPDYLEFDTTRYPRETCPEFPYKSFNKFPD